MGWNIWNKELICGPFNKTLKVNEACLNVVSNFDTPLKFYTKNTECFKCDFQIQGTLVSPHSTTSYIIDTRFGMESYFSDGKHKYCEMTNQFGDFGVYSLNITRENCTGVEVVRDPENLWANVGLLLLICLGAVEALLLLKFIYRQSCRYLSSTNVPLRELEMDLGNPNSRERRSIRARRQSRVASIDAFRGITIVLMIFVNNGGGDYSVFKHAPWNGLHLADVVFPWFVWLMGASVVLSLRSNLRTSIPKTKIFGRILKRTILLILFGLMLNSGNRYGNNLRICGVLQRLGITYFVVASLELAIAKPQMEEVTVRVGRWVFQNNILHSWKQWIFVIGFAVVHELITFMLHVPGCPTGYLGAGGFSEHSSYRNCTGGAAGYIDRLIITDNHMYHHGTFFKIYKPPVPFDPEGLLGIFTSVVCAFLGAFAARIILKHYFEENYFFKIQQWLFFGVTIGITAGCLCNWSKDYGIIPVNKNLWSLSYVLACSSLAFLVLSILYYLIDCRYFWSGFPFLYPGMNSITLYLGHSLLKQHLPWKWVPFTNTHIELLIMDVTAAVVWTGISYVLYKCNIFIKL